MFQLSFFAATLVGASIVSASSILDVVSSTCKSALQTILVSPEAQCLNAGAVLTFALSPNQTVDAFADKWLTGLCSTGSCPNSTISTIISNFTAGCGSDITSSAVVSLPSNEVLIDYATTYYSTVREVACLKDTGANALCVPQTLSSLESAIGHPLSSADLDINTLVADINTLISSNYANLACTSCIKAAYTMVAKVFPFPDLLAKAQAPISATCGASFLDGTISGVAQTAISCVFASQSNIAIGVAEGAMGSLLVTLGAFAALTFM